jgi:D-alanine-D-alanine ligase
MQSKLSLGVIFGGRSGEHEVSLVSAASVIKALDGRKYDVVPVGITKDGRWFSSKGVLEDFKAGRAPDDEHEAVILPEPGRRGLYFIASGEFRPLDAVFPVLHGPYGEDGTVQGLFEMAGLPYVGAGVLGSSVGMDKILQKEIARQAGIPTADSVWFLSEEFLRNEKDIVTRIESSFKYPVFVKPSNSGSSVGISKSHDRKELVRHIKDAARYDRRVIVEEGIVRAREIEVSILGNDEPIASCAGEVIPSNEFYDYDAKYVDGKSRTVVPAELSKNVEKKVQEMAIKAFRMLDLCGMARVDFLVTDSEVYFNEVNTIPGFTSISMYPKLMEASGIPYPKLLDELVNLAIDRHEKRSKLLMSYKPKNDWFRK